MEEKRIYTCKFCGMSVTKRKKMRLHEEHCQKNPASKGCLTCDYHYFELYPIDGRRLPFICNPDLMGKKHACKAGMEIATDDNGLYRSSLRTDCDYWRKAIKDESEDPYYVEKSPESNPQRIN